MAILRQASALVGDKSIGWQGDDDDRRKQESRWMNDNDLPIQNKSLA